MIFFKVKKMDFAVGTKQAAKILGVTVSRLHQATWLEKFPPPEKLNGGYCWTLEDLRRAHKVLHGRSLDMSKVPAEMLSTANRMPIVA